MKDHADIIAALGGPDAVQHRLGIASIHTVRSWAQRRSIPVEHWPAIVATGKATMDDLLAGRARRKSKGAAPRAAA